MLILFDQLTANLQKSYKSQANYFMIYFRRLANIKGSGFRANTEFLVVYDDYLHAKNKKDRRISSTDIIDHNSAIWLAEKISWFFPTWVLDRKSKTYPSGWFQAKRNDSFFKKNIKNKRIFP